MRGRKTGVEEQGDGNSRKDSSLAQLLECVMMFLRREGEDQGRGLCEKKQVVKETIVVLPESRCGAAFGEVRASMTDWLKLHEQDLAAPEIVVRP